MAREMTGLKFYFRNGETWTIDRRFIVIYGSNILQQVLAVSMVVNLLKFIHVKGSKLKFSKKEIMFKPTILT